MSNPSTLDEDRPIGPGSEAATEPAESFGDILSQYEQSHSHRIEEGKRGLEGTVIAVTGESVYLDIGFKTEGIIALADFQSAGETVKAGDKIPVSIKGRDPEGYYELSRTKVERPKDWTSLEKAFAGKTPIAGVVTAVVKGGLSVDVGVRAFMPASRSGARDAAEMEKLVGQEISCRIIKLEVADEDVVVDRRAVLEEEERASKDRRYSEIKEGETVQGVVRSLADYGAFVDVGGVDALLHVADISWGRVNKPADALAVFKTSVENDPALKPRTKEYCTYRISALLKSWPGLVRFGESRARPTRKIAVTRRKSGIAMAAAKGVESA